MREDLVRLDEEDESSAGFYIRCKKCGSENVAVKNTLAFYESCTMGEIEITCEKCGNHKTIYEP